MRLVWGPLFALLLGGQSELTNAGEFDRSFLPAATVDPAPCGGHGVGEDVRKGTTGCRRISGYVAAGSQFGSDDGIGGRPSPFGKLDAPEFVGAVRAAGAALIGAPAAGLHRIFLSPSPDETR